MIAPRMAYEIAMAKLDEVPQIEAAEFAGHRFDRGSAGFRVLVGAFLVALGRRISGDGIHTPLAGAR